MAWRDYDAAAKQVEVQKDTLLDQVEERLQQQASNQMRISQAQKRRWRAFS
jgi:hypothetical protein